MAILGDDTGSPIDGSWADPGYVISSHGTSGVAGTVTSIHVIVVNNDGVNPHNVKVAIYTDDAGNDRPQAQLAAEIEIEVPAGVRDQEISGNYTASLDASTKYWISVLTDDANVEVSHYDHEANAHHWFTVVTYDMPATAPDSGGNGTDDYWLWAEYTEDSGSAVPIILGLQRRMRS